MFLGFLELKKCYKISETLKKGATEFLSGFFFSSQNLLLNSISFLYFPLLILFVVSWLATQTHSDTCWLMRGGLPGLESQHGREFCWTSIRTTTTTKFFQTWDSKENLLEHGKEYFGRGHSFFQENLPEVTSWGVKCKDWGCFCKNWPKVHPIPWANQLFRRKTKTSWKATLYNVFHQGSFLLHKVAGNHPLTKDPKDLNMYVNMHFF